MSQGSTAVPKSRARRYAELLNTPDGPPPAGSARMERAIVLGGSMAGLLAARVLSEHAREVVIIEPDRSEVAAGPRPGAPHGSQVHGLLPAGQAQLERWFPGFAEAAAAGDGQFPPPANTSFFFDGRLRPITPVAGPALLATRPFIEGLVHSRTVARENVRVVPGRAQGLIFEGSRVAGVRYAPAAGDAATAGEGPGDPQELTGDLVVDAMGRSSRLSEWLEQNGWPRPPMQRMPIKLNYATALFRRSPGTSDIDGASVAVCVYTPQPGQIPRIGGFNVIEGDRWIMLIAGYGDDRPDGSLADYAARCRKDFPAPFGRLLDSCEMIGDVITYHQADSRRRDFHLLERLPAGLVATGDAVASFNPVYGQGMTSAILHAGCLSAYLRSQPDPDRPARAYFDQVRVVVDTAWQVSAMPDLALPHVDGPYPRGYRFASKAGAAIMAASYADTEVNARLTRVMGMLAHADTLMSPRLLLRVLRVRLRPGAAAPAPVAVD